MLTLVVAAASGLAGCERPGTEAFVDGLDPDIDELGIDAAARAAARGEPCRHTAPLQLRVRSTTCIGPACRTFDLVSRFERSANRRLARGHCLGAAAEDPATPVDVRLQAGPPWLAQAGAFCATYRAEGTRADGSIWAFERSVRLPNASVLNLVSGGGVGGAIGQGVVVYPEPEAIAWASVDFGRRVARYLLDAPDADEPACRERRAPFEPVLLESASAASRDRVASSR